jgi:23S rRNA maturation mini-RNase III
MNSERIAINVQKSALKKSLDALEERDREIYKHGKTNLNLTLKKNNEEEL